MSKAREVPDIDRLIEEGLTRYGQGDLDGALRIWEQVLTADPDNAQAQSYVDYVRMNYEILTADARSEERAPFGIGDDEPEYLIEILPGEVQPGEVQPGDPAPMYMDPLDEGWFLDEGGGIYHPSEASDPGDQGDGDEQVTTLELEADEPPEALRLSPSGPSETSEVGFDDATREYPQGRARTRDHVASQPIPEPTTGEFQREETPAFGPLDAQTPTGFGSQVTEHRRRDLGFVKTRDLEPDSFAETVSERPRTPSVPAELKITVRTPTRDHAGAPEPAARAARDARDPAIAAAIASLELEPIPEPPPPEPGAFALSYAGPEPALADDLIASLPSPRPAGGFASTRDLPAPGVTPAAAPPLDISLYETQDVPILPTAPTRDLGEMPSISLSGSSTQDFSEKPTERHRLRAHLDSLVSAPTRELGLRPGRAPTEDEPTVATVREPRGATIAEDPIEARAGQILDEIDREAPAQEPKDERTRRRITMLLDHAGEWSRSGDLERAVTAVDLALSEEPGSALAQKLVHRHRDAILNVFQVFLGDLERQPALARPLHELGDAPISPRAAFLLSRIDGTLTLDEILDVCGMPRVEAYRYLSQLFLRGILR